MYKRNTFRSEPIFAGEINTKKGIRTSANKQEQDVYKRDYAPSPVFLFKNASLSSGSLELFDIHSRTPENATSGATEKYGVFTNMRITNNSGQQVFIYINQEKSRVKVLNDGQVLELASGDLGGGYTTFSIYNNGSGTAIASTIYIECWKDGVESTDLIQKVHKTFFERRI